MFTVHKTPLNDVVIVEPKMFGDDRGWFIESYNAQKFHDIGITEEFIQDNHSHILCKSCGEVTDVYINTNHMMDNISKKYSFVIDQTDLVFSGTCKKCNIL